MKRIGVLISGRGSNLQALIDAQQRGELGGEIALVFSNVETRQGLERAREAAIPTAFCDHRGRPREEFDAEVVALLRAARRRAGLPGRLHAAALARVRACLPAADPEHPPRAVAGLSRAKTPSGRRWTTA